MEYTYTGEVITPIENRILDGTGPTGATIAMYSVSKIYLRQTDQPGTRWRHRCVLKISRSTAIWAPSGRFEAIWSDQLLVAAVIEPLRAVSGSADATSGFSDAKLA